MRLVRSEAGGKRMTRTANEMSVEEYRVWEKTGRFPDRMSQPAKSQLAKSPVDDKPAAGSWSRFKGLDVGRTRRGQMNKTEASFARELDSLMAAGAVAWWKYEALRLRLTDPATGVACWYTPDFWLEPTEGRPTLIDVKGGQVNDASVLRAKMCGSLYPQFSMWLVTKQKVADGGGWLVTDLSANPGPTLFSEGRGPQPERK